MHVNKVIDVYISTITLINNSPVLLSKYHLLESLSTKSSDLKNNPLHLIKLNNIMKELTNVLEDNDVEMDIVCWGDRGKITSFWSFTI